MKLSQLEKTKDVAHFSLHTLSLIVAIKFFVLRRHIYLNITIKPKPTNITKQNVLWAYKLIAKNRRVAS